MCCTLTVLDGKIFENEFIAGQGHHIDDFGTLYRFLSLSSHFKPNILQPVARPINLNVDYFQAEYESRSCSSLNSMRITYPEGVERKLS